MVSKKALRNLKADDRYRVIVFDRYTKELTKGWRAVNTDNVNKTIAVLDRVKPGNNTNLYQALALGTGLIEAEKTTAIILVTDGVANVGPTTYDRFRSLMKKSDFRLFTIIMGNSANKPLLEPLTKLTNGTSIAISNNDDIVGKLFEITSKVSHEAWNDITLNIDGVKVTNMTPQHITSLYRGEQLVIMGHYWGDGEARVTLSAKNGNDPVTHETRVAFPEISEHHPEIERLWALAQVSEIQEQIDIAGESDDLKQGITDIALSHGIVTPYTSMIVLEESRYQVYGIDRNNQTRVIKEQKAQVQRQAQPIKSNRVDTKQPLFKNKQATYSSSGGGGSVDLLWMLMLIMALSVTVIARCRTRA